jgi:hypothetical protein
MVVCALTVSLGYAVIANDYFEWYIFGVWMLISSFVGWSTYTNYKTLKYFKKIESEYKSAITNEICITKLLYEGKYEPYERPACDD